MRHLYYLGIYIICICPALGLSCAPGTYISVTDQTCEICPENYYCPGHENIETIYQSRYITVPYLESDDYSYINTQIIPTMDMNFYFLGELPETLDTEKRVTFYCGRTGPNNALKYTTYGCFYNPKNPTLFRAYRNSRGMVHYDYTEIKPLSGRMIEYQTDGEYFYLNGDKYKFAASHPTEQVPYPIYLFTINEENNGTYINDGIMNPGVKLYRWRVTQGDTVLQDMIPVYDTISEKYGMYDIITNEFFGNGNDQGNFAGLDIKKSCATETDNVAPHSPAGATSISDCGRILHAGDYKLYLKTEKQTSPSLAVQYGDHILYGAMTTDVRGHLRTEYNGAIYSIFTPGVD